MFKNSGQRSEIDYQDYKTDFSCHSKDQKSIAQPTQTATLVKI